MIYSATTELLELKTERIRVQPVSAGVISYYQPLMSKATWRPAAGRKLGFLVTYDDSILGLIFLASPVIRLEVRDRFLFPNASKNFDYGSTLRNYMDMSVCVAAQPIGWYWNIGKLLALIAPTLGDHFEAQYGDSLKGVTTTSIWGSSSQYNRVYKFLGYTKGFGHEHISDFEYTQMLSKLRARCSHCTPNCTNSSPIPDGEKCLIPSAAFGEGSNPRMRRIAAYYKVFGAPEREGGILYHGKQRGVYFHPAVSSEQRQTVIQRWFERWGLPRYDRVKNQLPPYRNGLEGKAA